MRTYKPRPTYRRGRMLRAARLRGDGLSLRQIAAELEVHHDTVWRDLKSWDEEQKKVTRLSDRPVGMNAPGGHESDTQSDSDGARILPMRRTS